MRYIYTLVCLLFCVAVSTAQSSNVKRFAKIHNDKKYIISESVYEDGHKEQFITSVPLSEARKMRTKDPLEKMRNIEWDVDGETKGLQLGNNDIKSIEAAFNHAFSEIENQMALSEGSIKRIKIEEDFLDEKEGLQSLLLVNKVISSLSAAKPFADLIQLEAADEKIAAHSGKLAQDILVKGYSSSENAADKIGYRNVEFSEHVKNDAIFLTNGKDKTRLAHVKAVYNWIFADAHTGWYNRKLLLNQSRNNGSHGLKDDYARSGSEGFIGLGIASGTFMESVVLDPTFNQATSVVFQLVDPLKKSKYSFEIQEINTGSETGIAASR